MPKDRLHLPIALPAQRQNIASLIDGDGGPPDPERPVVASKHKMVDRDGGPTRRVRAGGGLTSWFVGVVTARRQRGR
jgi:hypothetical protein